MSHSNKTAASTAVLDLITEELNRRKDRSAWDKGVTVYALELAAELRENIELGRADIAEAGSLEKALLCGAESWSQYSNCGCSLRRDSDIAERLCTPAELKRRRGGELPPNGRESWLDVQTSALRQAAALIEDYYPKCISE